MVLDLREDAGGDRTGGEHARAADEVRHRAPPRGLTSGASMTSCWPRAITSSRPNGSRPSRDDHDEVLAGRELDQDRAAPIRSTVDREVRVRFAADRERAGLRAQLDLDERAWPATASACLSTGK